MPATTNPYRSGRRVSSTSAAITISHPDTINRQPIARKPRPHSQSLGKPQSIGKTLYETKSPGEIRCYTDTYSTKSCRQGSFLKTLLAQLVSTPLGAFAVLALAAYLEVYGDACFSSGLWHATGAKRLGWFATGAAVLIGYSLFLNSSQIDFGKLLGIYVVLFFVVAQLVAKFKFHQSPTPPIYVGGTLIIVGGIVMTFWKQ